MKPEHCREMLESLSLFIEREAPPELCEQIRRHLDSCINCRIVVDTLRRTIDLYHRLPQPEMPEKARERLYKRLDLSKFLK